MQNYHLVSRGKRTIDDGALAIQINCLRVLHDMRCYSLRLLRCLLEGLHRANLAQGFEDPLASSMT